MPPIISRKLEYDDRVALQQADQAIRKDVIRALVEIITNSNDSYDRLEDAAHNPNGSIIIEVQRRRSDSLLRIRDYAEGMSGDQLDHKVGTCGAATSGFKEGRSVRGLWGRGLKDAFYGLGHGYVESFWENTFNRCSLSIKRGVPTYERDEPVRATRVVRKQYDVPSGNGTIMEIIVSRPDLRVPQFEHIRRSLERHFELRTVMGNPKRLILLRELDGRGKVRQEIALGYRPPTGVQVLNEDFAIPDFPATVHLQVFRSDVELSTPGEEPEYADGGLLIISKHAVLAQTLLKFESNEYASRLYGSVSCDYLYELLIKEPPEPILTVTRDGINWKHPFTKALKLAVETRLEPLIEEERRRAQAAERSAINKKLRERLNSALKELNSIANMELGNLGDGESGGRIPSVPASGFGFVPEYVYVQSGKPGGLTLRASVPDKIAHGSLVTIESDNPELAVFTPHVIVEEREDFPGVGQARVQVEGRQVGTEAIVTARVDGLEAEAFVKVISKKEGPAEPHEPRPHGGLFRDVKFDARPEMKQRVWFDKETANIIVAIKAPSVSPYILDETGKGTETPQGQVMLAELIAEAVCREIARRGVERGDFIYVPGAEGDAIQREYIRLQLQYAHRIHGCFVNPEYRQNGNA
jgi:hypothetical protein